MRKWLLICIATFTVLQGLLACKAEQPQAQVRHESTSVPTAVLPSSNRPTPSLLEATTVVTVPSPTATSSLLATRPTVRDFITESGISLEGVDADVLAQRIIAFEPLNSEKSFLMGYFVEGTGDEFWRELHFLKFDKVTQSWSTMTLREPERPESLDSEFCPPTVCYGLGVPTGYLETPHFYFVYMHYNPSAGWTIVLTPDLELEAILYGSVRAAFKDGTAVYNEGIIHFAPTHYTLISVYDPASKESTRIFPSEPYQPLWRARQQLVAQTYANLGEAWCREHNHHCNAALFNNGLSSEIVINDETDSLAFVVTFAGEFGVDLPEETAVYIYRGIQANELEYREVSQPTLAQLFGEYELADLLEPDALERIFTEVAFTEDRAD